MDELPVAPEVPPQSIYYITAACRKQKKRWGIAVGDFLLREQRA